MILTSIIVGVVIGVLAVLPYEEYTNTTNTGEHSLKKSTVFWLAFLFGTISTYVVLSII